MKNKAKSPFRKRLLKTASAVAGLGAASYFSYYHLNINNDNINLNFLNLNDDVNSRSKRSFGMLEGVSDELGEMVSLSPDNAWEWADSENNWLQNQVDQEGMADDVKFFQSAPDQGGKRAKKPGHPGSTGLNDQMSDAMITLFNNGWRLVDFGLQALDVKPVNPRMLGKVPDNVHKGFDDTAEFVNNLVENLHCSDNEIDLFNGKFGQFEITAMIPTDPILFAKGEPTMQPDGSKIYTQPIADYQKYTDFVKKFLSNIRENGEGITTQTQSRFNIASYSSNTMKMNFRGRLGHKSFWNLLDNVSANQLRYPKATISQKRGQDPQLVITQPQLPKIASRLTAYLYTKGETQSTPFAAKTSVVLWFISSPPDLSAHQDPEMLDAWAELRQKAVVVPIGIGVDEDKWGKFMAYLIPEYQEYYSKDFEFGGNLLLKTMDELVSDAFKSTLIKYLCLVIHRSSCRLIRKGNIEDNYSFQTEIPETYAPWLDDDFDRDSINPEDYADSWDEDLERLISEEKVQYLPNSCCGHDAYTARAYDSSYFECCEDGKVSKLPAFDEESSCRPLKEKKTKGARA